METIVTIDGAAYTFETSGSKTELKITAESSPSKDKTPKKIITPHAWLITRKDGTPLFAVRPDTSEKSFRILTADQLYSEKVQWFEPLADKYRKLIWENPDSQVPGKQAHSAYKHFSWQEIIDFAKVDRWSVSFYSNLPGDWKQAKEGGDKFLMVMVGKAPYWTDAIGQIPFSVDTFKMHCEELGEESKAISQTVQTGMDWGEGTVTGAKDKSNEYDNFMVLRGALWASENHTLVKTVKIIPHRGGASKRTITTVNYIPVSIDKLKNPISAAALSQYGLWTH